MKEIEMLALIPARGGSKGVPNKNIKLLDGKPLIQYTIEQAIKSKYIDQIYISTDSIEIQKVCNEMGMQVSTLRPKELATDESPTIDTVIYTLKSLKEKGINVKNVILLQTTTPFRTVEFIDDAIEKYYLEKVDSLISVVEVPDKYNPFWIFKETNDKKCLTTFNESNTLIGRRQDLPSCFIRSGEIYIFDAKMCLNNYSLYGSKIGYIKSIGENINIDTMEDWERSENLINIANK